VTEIVVDSCGLHDKNITIVNGALRVVSALMVVTDDTSKGLKAKPRANKIFIVQASLTIVT
jgi:hypothetical protein